VTDEAKICCGRYDRVFPEYLFYGWTFDGLTSIQEPARYNCLRKAGKKTSGFFGTVSPLRVSVLYYLYYSAATVS
jgi:hypothetical protein